MHYKTMFDSLKINDPLSKQLVETIPKKVYALLEQMGAVMDSEIGFSGDMENLYYEFSNKGGVLYITVPQEKVVKISWTNKLTKMRTLRVSAPELQHTGLNLPFFIALEKAAYTSLDKLRAKLDAHRAQQEQNLSPSSEKVV